MSSTTESFQTYINHTLSSEEQVAADAARTVTEQHEQHLRALREQLQSALDEDDQKKAMLFAYQLLEENEEDEELQRLYDFLSTRVGVDLREPFFAFSLHPIVRSISAMCLLIPTIFLIAHILGPSGSAGQTDVVTCVLAAIVFGIPLIDCGVAAAFNRVNYYRLRN